MPGSDPKLEPTTRYQRISELGRGGMASVYLAALRGPQGFQKLVVIKEMKPELASREEFRDMFFAEARLAAQLSHPNVVHTFEVVEDPPGVCSIIMEFLDGQPLGRVRNASSREVLLPLQLHVVAELLAGLDYLHDLTDFDGSALGLVHRDVSPQNVFLTYAGDVKILDFGIAKANHSAETAIGTIKGKLAYMAPEQALGHKVDRRTDIFSAGVLLWESLTGKRLWAGVAEEEIPGRLMTGVIPRPSDHASNVAADLEEICMRALASSPVDRYQTAGAFRADLVKFIDAMPNRQGRRELGVAVSSLFAEQRATVKSAIDASLAKNEAPRSRSGRVPRALPVTDSAMTSGSVAPFSATQILTPSKAPQPQSSFAVVVTALVAAVALGTIVGLVLVIRSRSAPPVVAATAPSTAIQELPSAAPSVAASVTERPVASAPSASTIPHVDGTRPTHFSVRPTASAVPSAVGQGRRPNDPPDLGY